jgi:hypothetical protein
MPPRTWAEMRESITAMLVRDTGHDVGWWNDQMAAELSIADEATLRAWLRERGVTGYKQMLLVMERFGYPEYLLATADALLAGQYADKSRSDLVLRLDGAEPGGRLLDGRNSAGGGLNVRIALQSVEDLDAEALDLLSQSYAENS